MAEAQKLQEHDFCRPPGTAEVQISPEQHIRLVPHCRLLQDQVPRQPANLSLRAGSL
jgi:hypothetical protein